MYILKIRASLLAFSYLIIALLSGCTSIGRYLDKDDEATKWNPIEVLPAMKEPIDLLALLTNGEKSRKIVIDQKEYEANLDSALMGFNVDCKKVDAVQPIETAASSPNGYTFCQKRDKIQDRIKIHSDLLCEDYKTTILQKQARWNFRLGATALFLGSAGALSTGVNTARFLSGTSALVNGVKSEHSQAYYLDQTAPIIVKAINAAQSTIYTQILKDRESNSYTIERAISDIGKYHSACSLAAAMATTSEALDKYDPEKSIKDTSSFLDKLKELKAKIP